MILCAHEFLFKIAHCQCYSMKLVAVFGQRVSGLQGMG